jgi:hypothetical protein
MRSKNPKQIKKFMENTCMLNQIEPRHGNTMKTVIIKKLPKISIASSLFT